MGSLIENQPNFFRNRTSLEILTKNSLSVRFEVYLLYPKISNKVVILMFDIMDLNCGLKLLQMHTNSNSYKFKRELTSRLSISINY